MSFKTSWWSLPATRAKRSTTIMFRAAMILAPLMVGYGALYYVNSFTESFLLSAIATIIVTVICYIPLFHTTKAEREQVDELLTDEDYHTKEIKVTPIKQISNHYMKLSYFPDTKEWVASTHIPPVDFVREIQTRDMLADSFHETDLAPYVRHVYGSYEFAPALNRHALKVLETNLPNTNPITVLRVPPNEE